MGRVTLQTIADHVGVSRMTVSNAFSRPDQLSARLRERILAVAEQLGYVGPDPTARALASGTAGTVGLLMSDTYAYSLTDEVAMTFIAAISDELAPTGLALTLLSAAPREGIIPARDVAVDGALVYSCDMTSPAVGWLMRRRLPVVFVDQPPASGIASINVDDRGGARAAAQHVLDLGHRRVGIVTSSFGGQYGIVDDPRAATLAYGESQRMLGWLYGLDAAGVTPCVIRLPHQDPHEIGYSAGQALLAQPQRPTAIRFSDAIAGGVIRAAQHAGLIVPDDVSVVGFDDNPIARRTQPTLTTVRQDVDAKGRAAINALKAAIQRAKNGSTPRRAKHLMLDTELIVRDSTAPAKAAR